MRAVCWLVRSNRLRMDIDLVIVQYIWTGLFWFPSLLFTQPQTIQLTLTAYIIRYRAVKRNSLPFDASSTGHISGAAT